MSLKPLLPLVALLAVAACQRNPAQLDCAWNDVEQDERECFVAEPIDTTLPTTDIAPETDEQQ
jgi:hypothetical protein